MSKLKLSPKRHTGNGSTGSHIIAAKCARDPEFAAWWNTYKKHRYHNDPTYREACIAYQRDYREQNREARRERDRAQKKRRYHNDPTYREAVLAACREYREQNREAIRERDREYRVRKRVRLNADRRARSKPGFREASTGVGFLMRTDGAE